MFSKAENVSPIPKRKQNQTSSLAWNLTSKVVHLEISRALMISFFGDTMRRRYKRVISILLEEGELTITRKNIRFGHKQTNKKKR